VTSLAQPTIYRKNAAKLDYGIRPRDRLLFALGACLFAALAYFTSGDSILSRLAWYLVAALLALAALSEDRWRFFAARPGEAPSATAEATAASFSGLRRRFGILPLLRSWELPLERLYSVSLRSGRAGESPNGVAGDRERLEASMFGMGRGAWVALSIELDNGRKLVLTATKPKKVERLRADGRAIALCLGLEFSDSTGL
jgi:hypothetical protein